MNTIPQLMADIELFKKGIFYGKESDKVQYKAELVNYLSANQKLILDFLHLAYVQHTADDRRCLLDAHDGKGRIHSLHSDGVEGFDYNNFLNIFQKVEIQKKEPCSYLEISDDNLHILYNGLRYAFAFERIHSTAPIQFSPVRLTLPSHVV